VLYLFFKTMIHFLIMVRADKSKSYGRGEQPVTCDALSVGITKDSVYSLPTFDHPTFNRIYGKFSECLGRLKGDREKGRVIHGFCSKVYEKYDTGKIKKLGRSFNQIVGKYSKGIQSKKIAESPRFVSLEVDFANYLKALLTGSDVLKTNSERSDLTEQDLSPSVTAAANYRWCLREMKETLESLKKELKSLY
ncbi:MAG: hypothetical protein KAT94_02350, partial [Candidatus Aenigmarchaeota archaeon]|nr:hypothetical protein [Candidatus Aenigmarchaeota archaeon]